MSPPRARPALVAAGTGDQLRPADWRAWAALCQGEFVSEDLLGGRYRLDAVLGRGGMAAVWRGVDIRLDRSVAVKVLDGAALIDPAAVERFHREARTVARLADPHVVAVYDVGSDGDRHYLVMELVSGTSLAGLLRQGPLDAGQAVDIAIQVCQALHAAHAAGVVHRDVKPGNILIDRRGAVKVCDFGIARLVGAAQPTLTAVGATIGTSQYMAPEQVAGGPVDGRTDLYALGCVLYAMLTGRPPFDGDSAVGIALQHLHRDPEPIGHLRPDLPGALADLVDRLLAKEPDHRPGAAARVRATLAGIAAGGVVADSPTTPLAAARATAIASPPTLGALTANPSAGTSPTRAMPWAGERRAAPPRSYRPPVGVLAALAVLGIIIAALLLVPWWNRTGAQPQGSGASPTATAAAAPAPTRAPPVATAKAPAARAGELLADRIAGLQDLVAAEAAAGRLDRKSAEEIAKELGKLEKELAEGRDDKVFDKTRDVARKLVELRARGKIGDETWESLRSAMGELGAVEQPGGKREDRD